MGFFNRLRGKRKRRVVVIGLDGTPYTFVQRALDMGRMPNFARMLGEGAFRRMNSVHPCVSSVAWSCYMTGKNPAKHGIYGFIDRKPGTYDTAIPTSRTMRSETLWEILSRAGKRVVVMNVPVTYPPRQVNGILISGFLSPKVEKAVYPPTEVGTLKRLGYIIDADPWAARQSKDKALAEVNAALDSRVRTLLHYMDNEEWDFLQCHVMETDRLYHFLWEQMDTADPVYAPRFWEVIARIDQMLGEVLDRLDEHTTLIVMSDHGFCTLKYEVYVNHWLAQRGWLTLPENPPQRLKLADVGPRSRAYSLDPGRIFINLRGREPAGRVAPGAEYEALRDEIAAAALEDMRDPETGAPMIARVFRREELYHGPLLDQAADLILVSVDGYDLKGAMGKDTLTFKGDELVGMHTYDDAMLWVQGQAITAEGFCVTDVMPTVLRLMDVPIPDDVDGRVLI